MTSDNPLPDGLSLQVFQDLPHFPDQLRQIKETLENTPDDMKESVRKAIRSALYCSYSIGLKESRAILNDQDLSPRGIKYMADLRKILEAALALCKDPE